MRTMDISEIANLKQLIKLLKTDTFICIRDKNRDYMALTREAFDSIIEAAAGIGDGLYAKQSGKPLLTDILAGMSCDEDDEEGEASLEDVLQKIKAMNKAE